MKKPVILVIMDGYGIRKETYGNAIAKAKKPNLDKYFANYPYTQIQASGLQVGLPEGQMGNSEVGHLNIGAGRIVYQSLTLIDQAIKDGSFYQNPKYLAAMQWAKSKGKKLHIVGLVSDGGVHSHLTHLQAIIKLAAKQAMGSSEPLKTPVAAYIYITVPIPQSYPKKRFKACLEGLERPCKKPDIDNIIKAYLDSMNGIVYDDDTQVVSLHSIKVYGTIGMVEVLVKEDMD